MGKELLIGVNGFGTIHASSEQIDLETRFRRAKESGFDYIDRMPLPGEVELYIHLSQKYELPIVASGWYYTLGRDEALLDWHFRIAKEIGSKVINIQFATYDAYGKFVSNEQIVDAYLSCYEKSSRFGVDIAFEIHANMWSEHFGRVSQVGEMVEASGVPFNITLDHSHVIFKIDNPREQEVQDMRKDIEAGLVKLSPDEPGNVTSEWIARNYVRHSHARSAVPANPINVWAHHPDGSPGRGIQYPFIKPGEGEWHSEWDESRLEPWKSVVRNLLRHHASDDSSRLGQMSMEFVPATDYGAGSTYSILDNNVACANWVREEWKKAQAEAA